MGRFRKFCQSGSNFDNFCFLVDDGREDPHTTIIGPSWPASETPFKWCLAGGPMMAQH